jgi:regulator of protease activity HflC (stomatin/prohibitin superfamily)
MAVPPRLQYHGKTMNNQNASREIPFKALSGYLMLLPWLLALGLAVLLFAAASGHGVGKDERTAAVVAGFVLLVCFVLISIGFFIVEPNMGRALILFGRYRGTVRSSGFWWTNPFTVKRRISLRAHNLNGKTLKVNDLLGNPIEIAAVVVWQIRDTAQALFDVEQFEHFVEVQGEAAVRCVAAKHPYDDGQASEVSTTLRGSADAVAEELAVELRQRLAIAGIEVQEARLSHLAYAPEIAAAMLQRQQAGAIIAARAKIVEGAVSMVEMALADLSKKNIVHLDDERKAALVGNLLVVLCGQQAPSPVVNAGSLHS